MIYQGCDTLWKHYKRSVWVYPDRPFLGERIKNLEGEFGEYKWLTWKESDKIVEALSKSIINKKMCPIIISNTMGTPDLKMIGIFSENRKEWLMTELACCSDSICIVPLAVEAQFLAEDRLERLLNETQLETVCVSEKTFQIVLNLKSEKSLPHLKKLILFDPIK